MDAPASLLVIVGPTAAGKSSLAMEIAAECRGEIVTADSLQVYRGLDIGTAKPTVAEQARIPHHLLDLLPPDAGFTAADFCRHASAAIADITARGCHPLLVGGTGLYVRTLLGGLMPAPPEAPQLREELRAEAAAHGGAALHARLAALDPATAAGIDPRNLVRVIRALELCLLTGQPVSALRAAHGFRDAPYRTLKFGIDPPREVLWARIDQRVEEMLQAGLVAEVERLLAAGYAPTLKPLGAIGYKEVCAYLAGQCTLAAAAEAIKRHTRHYAKRQLTWFRADKEIIWLASSTLSATIRQHVNAFFR